MEALANFISAHQSYAHWLIFGSILLAGFGIPISIDVVMICSALLAANIIPENVGILFSFTLVGCLLSAWIAYWLGRTAGPKLIKLPVLRTALSEKRLEKTKAFYQKYGFWTFIVGRFIPFGVRNCIFMSSGLSRMAFWKFALFDFIACALWASIAFYAFYSACSNYSTLVGHVKIVNITIFSTFAVAVIGLVCYKKKKTSK
ncbi:MAG TPA: DedA family protein [Chlamydiales bacterium]|nr:DedA family protein [Chlamydiales bacterium]HPE85571.1 DedA family protein [Chlamydiales bacterium]